MFVPRYSFYFVLLSSTGAIGRGCSFSDIGTGFILSQARDAAVIRLFVAVVTRVTVKSGISRTGSQEKGSPVACALGCLLNRNPLFRPCYDLFSTASSPSPHKHPSSMGPGLKWPSRKWLSWKGRLLTETINGYIRILHTGGTLGFKVTVGFRHDGLTLNWTKFMSWNKE